MNARDNIKPKSIRLAILAGLASGAITTIDDLQIRIGEPRKKVAQNVYPAAIDGLIRCMKDDITGGPAYQITDKGLEYLAKYSDGSKAEPLPEPAPVAPETKQAEAVAVKVLEDAMPGFGAEVIAQKDTEIASMSRRLRDAFADVDRLNKELEEVKASLELSRMARKVEPVGYVVQRPAKPLTRFSKLDRAKYRAVSSARGGKRAQVFALVAVGTAVPGAEWKQA